MTKLYDVPRNTWVMPTEDTVGPPASIPVFTGEEVLFKHLDGMYSYCKNKHGEVVHLPAWQEVVVCETAP